MIDRIVAALLLFAPLPTMAASLTLGCSGTATTTRTGAAAADPEKENITDFSVVVDFDHRTVSGFWADLNGVHTPLPVTAADANSITFGANKKIGGTTNSIYGSVDRITGAVDATDTSLWVNGGSTVVVFDLHCKPTRPLF